MIEIDKEDKDGTKDIVLFNIARKIAKLEEKTKLLKLQYAIKSKSIFDGYSNKEIFLKAISGFKLDKDMKWVRVDHPKYAEDYIYDKLIREI